jgi:DNA-binding response OmpR family regulator
MTPPSQPKPIILLAEDSDDDAYFFERAFGRASLSCELKRAANGKIAVELLDHSRLTGTTPSLIFLDLKMPVMSGFDVLEWLKHSRLSPMPPVIVLSGSDDHADRAHAFSLGAADYLVKPITIEILRDRVVCTLKRCNASVAGTGAPA